jgi:hypothetical protein
MKKVSVFMFLEVMRRLSKREFYKEKIEKVNSEEQANSEGKSVSKDDSLGGENIANAGMEDQKTVRKIILNEEGKNVVDILRTIDAINSVDVAGGEDIVIDSNPYYDYVIMSCLKPFIKPAKVIIGSETGISQLDLLDDSKVFKFDVDYSGKVLNKKMFEFAQARLCSYINNNNTGVSDLTKVSRDVIVLNEEVIQTYPINTSTGYMAVVEAKVPKFFPIRGKYYADWQYRVEYTKELYVQWLTVIVQGIKAVANTRAAAGSN